MALGGSHDIDPSDGADAMMGLFLTSDYLTSENPRLEEIKKIMIDEKAEQGSGAFWHQFNAIVTHDVVETIKGVKAPTLIMVGSEDPVARPDNARFLHKNIEGSTLHVYDGLRHAYWVEHVEKTTEDILGFIDSQAS